MAKKRARKKAAKKAVKRKRPLKNKGVKRNRKTGRHMFSNNEVAKYVKAHNEIMPHGYELKRVKKK